MAPEFGEIRIRNGLVEQYPVVIAKRPAVHLGLAHPV
jgi:hypothetical protein